MATRAPSLSNSCAAAAVREILRAEGFAPLPRRGDDERLEQVGPSA